MRYPGWCKEKSVPSSRGERLEPDLGLDLRWLTHFSHNSSPQAASLSPLSTVTQLTTPLGMPALSHRTHIARAEKGVSAGALITTVHPAARAGASLRVIMAFGKFLPQRGRQSVTSDRISRRGTGLPGSDETADTDRLLDDVVPRSRYSTRDIVAVRTSLDDRIATSHFTSVKGLSVRRVAQSYDSRAIHTESPLRQTSLQIRLHMLSHPWLPSVVSRFPP